MKVIEKKLNEIFDNYIGTCFDFREFGITFETFYKNITSENINTADKWYDKFLIKDEKTELFARLKLLNDFTELFNEEHEEINADKALVEYCENIKHYVENCTNNCAKGKSECITKLLEQRKKSCF